MSTTEVVQGELLPDVYEATPVPSTLFGTSDPTLALERMAQMARLLVDVVRDRKLVMKISGNEYLLAPGWAVLAGMTGLSPYTAWTRPLEDGTGYIARVEVRRVADGAVISAAEQVCSRSERKWAKAEEHALHGDGADARLEPRAQGAAAADRRARGLQGNAGRGDGRGAEDDVVRADPGRGQADEGAGRAHPRAHRELADERPDVDWREFAQEPRAFPGTCSRRRLADVVIEKLEAELGAEPKAAA